MTTLTVLIIALWAWGLASLAVGVNRYRRRKALRAIARAERVRGEFAAIRNRLVLLALEGKIAPDTATFRTIYFVTTAIMRRDDQYPEMHAALLDSLVSVRRDPPRREAMRREFRTWGPEVQELSDATNQAIEMLLVEYSSILRLAHAAIPYITRLLKRLSIPKKAEVKLIEKVGASAENLEAKYRHPEVVEIRREQKALFPTQKMKRCTPAMV